MVGKNEKFKFGMEDLLNLICAADMSVKGLANTNMCKVRRYAKLAVIGGWKVSVRVRSSRSICLKRRDHEVKGTQMAVWEHGYV